jgi:hypothetical protein
MANEKWVPVKGYEGFYEVSSEGRIKSVPHRVKSRGGKYRVSPGRVLKISLHRDGYIKAALCKRGIIKTFQVHRIVAEAFIANRSKAPQVNHKNGVKSDNRLENLEWCTRSENQQHAFRVLKRKHSTPPHRSGADHYLAKGIRQMGLDGKVIREWGSVCEAARGIGEAQHRIWRAANNLIVVGGISNMAGGFLWEFI